MENILYEVSWEVCNKVGGIHTVITTKLNEAYKNFADNYILLGPDLTNNQEFIEDEWPLYSSEIKQALHEKGIACRIGYLDHNISVKVILVKPTYRLDINILLLTLWQDFGVDSYGGEWDYVEPVLFSTTCGEAIKVINRIIYKKTNDSFAVAQFHEWMCGAGLLYLKKNCPDIGTVFTTHATVLGRALAHNNLTIEVLKGCHENAEDFAKKFGVHAKHSMEKSAIQHADCFTTVSEITSQECGVLLGKEADLIVYNGICPEFFKQWDTQRKLNNRNSVLDVCDKFLQKQFNRKHLQLWISSGRYEFHNKGFDVLLKAASELNQYLLAKNSDTNIILLVLVASGKTGLSDHASKYLYGNAIELNNPYAIATHKLHNEHTDEILGSCNKYSLTNSLEQKVFIIYSNNYLDGHDGVFNLHYYDILSACDRSLFPSFYEPWGYTPLESIAIGVPTMSSDLAGFGCWAENSLPQSNKAVTILQRQNVVESNVVESLVQYLQQSADITPEELDTVKHISPQFSDNASWEIFYCNYMHAYQVAAAKADLRQDTGFSKHKYYFHSFADRGYHQPRYYPFTVVASIPHQLSMLSTIAYNLWWVSNAQAQSLFAYMSPELWQQYENPVMLINTLSYKRLNELAQDEVFIQQLTLVEKKLAEYLDRPIYNYHDVMELSASEDFNQHVLQSNLRTTEIITKESPVAYFSMEYGLHKCLPIYAGGLGVLSGDYLKAVADLNLPMVAIGLLYKHGYLTQQLDIDGGQSDVSQKLNCSLAPIQALLDSEGKELLIDIPFPGRIITVKVWQVNIGNVKLYLLDTDISKNSSQDREITWKLYVGNKETRIQQEVILGVGGVGLLERLNINPCLYHLNEGHSAFSLIERIRLSLSSGLSTFETVIKIRAASVFTTHTPVAAGNEAFADEMVVHYFGYYLQNLPITIERILEMGKADSHDKDFSLTIFALRFCRLSNGVAKLHGKVSRQIWHHVWPVLDEDDLPIISVTNAVHYPTWVGKHFRDLFRQYNIANDLSIDSYNWSMVNDIPYDELWNAHQEQKRDLLEYIKLRINKEYMLRGEDMGLVEKVLANLNKNVLTIGFARRIAEYKRAYLLFNDMDRLIKLVNNLNMPIVFIFAGKAHPSDIAGQNIIKQIIHASRDPRLNGRVIYIENYNLELAKYLVQGVDLWLNTPIVPMEASGTSGMKAMANGVLNCSIEDGWWYEAYNPKVGFAIGQAAFVLENKFKQDRLDQMDLINLYEVLENRVRTIYYTQKDGLPLLWLDIMRQSLVELLPQFNMLRMVKEYYSRMYASTAMINRFFMANNNYYLSEAARWFKRVRMSFGSVRVNAVKVKGLEHNILYNGSKLEIELFVDKGHLLATDLQAQLILKPNNPDDYLDKIKIISFVRNDFTKNTLKFTLDYTVCESGSYSYGLRLIPFYPHFSNLAITGLMYWV